MRQFSNLYSSSETFAFVKFINFSPSKLFPLTTLPFRAGPEADRARTLFKAGKEPTSLTEGFLDMLLLKGLYPRGIPFFI